MSKIISLVNQKGGVGKTTTSINLACALAHKGKKILLIDIDPQGNATTGLGIEKSELALSVYDLLILDKTAKEVIVPTKYANLDIMPTKIDLAGADIELVSIENREYRLKEKLKELNHDYDFILIDCPPSLGLLSINALAASDSVIIPVQCEYYAMEGLTQLLSTILKVQKNINKHLEVEGVLLTMLDMRTNLGLEVSEEVRVYFNDKVYDTIIPRVVRLSEAPAYGKSVIEYDFNSKGTKAYLNLADEVIAHNG